MSELPEGWSTGSVEELSGIGGLVSDGDWIESKDQDPNGSVRLIQLMDIGEGKFRDRSHRFLTMETAKRLNCTFLKEGDVLVARMPDPLGRACRFPSIGQQAVTAVDVFIWHAGERSADPDWLVYVLNSPVVRSEMLGQASGTTRQRIAGGKLKKLELSTPPLPEQKRIVAKLDSLTARSTRAREELDRIPRLVARYKQAVLAAVFGGQIITEMAGAPKRSIDELSVHVTKGASPKWQGFQYQETGIRFIRSQNVWWGSLKLDGEVFLPVEFNEKQKNSVLQEADVLLNIVGASIGRSAVVDERIAGGNCNQAVAVIRLKENNFVSARYLNLWLLTSEAQSSITAGSVDVARANFSLTSIKALNLPWPETWVQGLAIKAVDRAFAAIDRLVAEHEQAAALLERLDQSILAKAFQGRLVPQDPSDEPASVPLEKIRQERESRPKRPKAAKRRVTRMAKLTKESVAEAILALPKADFEFEELRAQVSGDYDTFKDILFSILSEPKPVIKQSFDADTQTMKLVRVE